MTYRAFVIGYGFLPYAVNPVWAVTDERSNEIMYFVDDSLPTALICCRRHEKLVQMSLKRVIKQ